MVTYRTIRRAQYIQSLLLQTGFDRTTSSAWIKSEIYGELDIYNTTLSYPYGLVGSDSIGSVTTKRPQDPAGESTTAATVAVDRI